MATPKCYSCIHRGTVAGDAHSSCNHPKSGGIAGLMKIMAGYNPLNIQANRHGVEMGWFMWPVNFDPAWLINCDGFKPKEKTDE